MGLRQRQWATKTRLKIKRALGERCFDCGLKEDLLTKPLEFDCIEPCGDYHHRMEYSWRTSFYRQKYFKFNLQLLCEKCHIKKTKQDSSNSPY